MFASLYYFNVSIQFLFEKKNKSIHLKVVYFYGFSYGVSKTNANITILKQTEAVMEKSVNINITIFISWPLVFYKAKSLL